MLFGKVHAVRTAVPALCQRRRPSRSGRLYGRMTNLGFAWWSKAYGLTGPRRSAVQSRRQAEGGVHRRTDTGRRGRDLGPRCHEAWKLAIKGPNVMLGYYKKPGATAEVIRGGWFYTGDLGYKDKDGYFFITGRSKEMIVLSTGKDIPPLSSRNSTNSFRPSGEICMVQTDRGLRPRWCRTSTISGDEHRERAETIALEIEDLARDLAPSSTCWASRSSKTPSGNAAGGN